MISSDVAAEDDPIARASLPDWSGELVTRTGFCFLARPATPTDGEALGEFFAAVSPDDLRFRFLSSVRHLPPGQLITMTDFDHRTTENFLAFDDDRSVIIATAMLAADARLGTAEVALAIRPDYKQLGVSWTLLEHVARFALAKGIKTLESIESRDNHEAIELEREMGFETLPCPDDPALLILRATLG
jgi:GNAT superfamily N-acetyltransferase